MSGRKLSKRDVEGDQLFLVKEFESEGILPEALVNYVALFGWSAKTDSDVHSMNELVSRVLSVLVVFFDNSFPLID
jgi:glutamyl/glutaminyl-tRNA synthetase